MNFTNLTGNMLVNYRHIYHAGNFADVLKHVVVSRIIEYLKRKEKAFRVIDTHAGTGIYDLTSDEAQKTGEWQSGIGLLLRQDPVPGIMELLQPYLDGVRTANPEETLHYYPGSPLLIRKLLRKQDRLTAIELHPDDARQLQKNLGGDFQVRVIALDGWLAPASQLPPKEKRGLVLIDPPFEKPGEFDRLADALITGYRRWPGGTYTLWYPIKDMEAVENFRGRLAKTGIPRILDIGLNIRQPSPEAGLSGSGIVIVNPPYTLKEEMASVLPFLGSLFAEDGQSRVRLQEISGE